STPGWKPSCMLPGCSRAKPSCEPGAFHSPGSTGPISIVPDCPPERLRLILRAASGTDLCKCKKLVDALWKSVRCLFRRLRNHPEPSREKRREESKKK